MLLALHLLKRGEGSFDVVNLVIGTQSLGNNVLDPGKFHDAADSATGNNTGTLGSRHHDELGSFVLNLDGVRDGFVGQRQSDHVLLGFVHGFVHAFRYIQTFLQAHANTAFVVANNNQRAETHALTAGNDAGYALYFNHFLVEFALFAFLVISRFSWSSVHMFS